ncbi:LacI family transcriptional regulator [Pseudooceanicola sp. CBS1P-1]|uniref:LacI family DNA-binding transcriptional regulator n=1 Tax=Pseudooceanicola albus TaxID=2692189 RepID=A0A6L7GBW0_9RHOB|nr:MULTISPECIES: LacI family DNA-binding transcriptional regulator [Pseudooceanicola]MBT9387035.1 LacI family transcriptional regulator [Pseudooceanicola endophyticus]MXN21192.1 LacI family DNA-binding transcriptional regulator [Pseudooceanicola albus]
MRRAFSTLKDVAAASGVSRSQASRALRGDPGVREDVRNRVLAAAQKLGYQVNVAARQLASGRGTSVGVVIGEPMNPYHMMMASEISEALQADGLDPIFGLGKSGIDVRLDQIELLLRQRVVAVILIGSPRDPQQLAEISQRLPCIYIGEDVSPRGIRCVIADDVRGGRLAVDHLHALGHRRIAHISGGKGAGAGARAEGYSSAMRDHGLEPVIHHAWFDLDGGHAGADALMARRERPTAIFAASDRIAFGAMNRLRGLGYRVPEDVSVVGFDDSVDSGSETISLTTVHQSARLFGRHCADLVHDILIDKAEALVRVIPVELIVRGSSSSCVG